MVRLRKFNARFWRDGDVNKRKKWKCNQLLIKLTSIHWWSYYTYDIYIWVWLLKSVLKFKWINQMEIVECYFLILNVDLKKEQNWEYIKHF